MRSLEEIVRSIDNTSKSIASIEEMGRLYKPIMLKMMGFRRAFDRAGAPLNERSVKLSKARYKNQFDGGVDRCCGVDIDWIN